MSILNETMRWLNLGAWVVRYPNGQRSRSMSCKIAKGYAKIFGGTIEPTDEPIRDMGLR